MKQGYANHKREELLKQLKPMLGKITNISTGIIANLSKKSLEKMTSAKALEKSKQNGFTLDEINKASERFRGLSDAAENQRTGQLRHLTSIIKLYHAKVRLSMLMENLKK